MKGRAHVSILGLCFAPLTVEEAAERILSWGREGRRPAVFTPGATVAAAAYRDPKLGELLKRADLLLPDGCGISLAARLCGKGRVARCPGIEVGERVLRLAAAEGARVYFYGGAHGVAARAACRWQKKYPSLKIRAHEGYGEVPLADILSFSPSFLFVCLGVPRQERFIAAHPELQTVCLALGGSLDVWSGRVARAPRALRRLGLEWLYRVWREPKRVLRLLPLPRYFFACLICGFGQIIQKRIKSLRSDGIN